MENLARRDGKAILELGHYDPIKKLIHFDKLNLHKYLNHGAYPTDSVRHLIYRILSN
jgi:ribosomal protein S16